MTDEPNDPTPEEKPVPKTSKNRSLGIAIFIFVVIGCKISIMLTDVTKPKEPSPSAVPAPSVYEVKCRGIMTDYAQKNHINPASYIAQNKDFLAKCSTYYANAAKPRPR